METKWYSDFWNLLTQPFKGGIDQVVQYGTLKKGFLGTALLWAIPYILLGLFGALLFPLLPRNEFSAMGIDDEAGKLRRIQLGLKMIALTRLFLKDVNIAATTALQALDPLGREKGLAAGANILMPIITIPEHRAKYLLYDNKPCVDDNADKCKDCLTRRVMSIGDTVGWKQNGDSKHYGKRTGSF